MVDYATPADDPSLFPDDPTDYALVLADTFKPPDSEEYINVIQEFSDAEFEFPESKSGYTYYVHRGDGETFTREEWPPEGEPTEPR